MTLQTYYQSLVDYLSTSALYLLTWQGYIRYYQKLLEHPILRYPQNESDTNLMKSQQYQHSAQTEHYFCYYMH